MAWLIWTGFTLILGRLAPVLIFPLFYSFKPLEEGDLKRRIITLVESNGLRLKNVYLFNMSKTTKKANAAFCGMGRTRRVILSDTLVKNFTSEEVEMVVAHEMGHCKLGHLWKRLTWGIVGSFAAFYLIYQISGVLCGAFGYNGLRDLASLPLIFLVFFVFGIVMMPIDNSYSRKHEYEADAFAVNHSANQAVFSSMMSKLGELNLSDPDPHPWIEFLLYDHPSIRHRIERVKLAVSR